MKKSFIIPGLGGAADCWAPVFTGRLSTCCKVESSPLPSNGTTIVEFARELIPDEPVDILIGFSIGAAVAQEMITHRPDIASTVVLMAPPAGNDFPQPPEDAQDFSNGRGKWSASMLEMMFTPEWLASHPDISEFFPRVKRQVPGERLIRQSNAISDWEGCRDALKKVSLPVLILAGRYDIITPLIHAQTLNKTLPNASLTVFDTGHGFPWQCPLETADKILEFHR
ncbi:MAG: alpha/beta hydrolase [Candidatus Sabulitectum sp.]|nr:alpha/beta hydrolase [Candidatus Sabulitectum sp.]